MQRRAPIVHLYVWECVSLEQHCGDREVFVDHRMVEGGHQSEAPQVDGSFVFKQRADNRLVPSLGGHHQWCQPIIIEYVHLVWGGMRGPQWLVAWQFPSVLRAVYEGICEGML